MDPAEEEQVAAVAGPELEPGHVDPVVDRGEVVELRVPVGIADRDVVAGRCTSRTPARSAPSEKPWIVVTTGVSTRPL